MRFFDDLIEGQDRRGQLHLHHLPDSCPLETAQLVRVQDILGDRLGRDVFFYSITIDPETDTPGGAERLSRSASAPSGPS